MSTARAIIAHSSFVLLLLITFSATSAARAQQTRVPQYSPPATNNSSSNGNLSPDSNAPGSGPLANRMAEEMAIERNNARQKEIVSQSARLLTLAKKLNADVAGSNKDQLSVSVVKEAAEIEKLAKSIKDKMRYGY